MGTKYQGSAKEMQSLNAFIKIKRAAESISSRLNGNLISYNLTESQLGVLEALYHLGSMCQKELSQKILKSTGNITLVIDNLEKRDLVQRVRDETDRRYITVRLTDQGAKLIADFFPIHVKAIAKEMSVLSQEELSTLGALCKKLGLR
jgi:MarR family 2-MHQ and catechol resistance regulon transcriptional repressor